MTTIPVERELLERLIDPSRRVPAAIHMHNADCLELRTLLSEQPQAGAGQTDAGREKLNATPYFIDGKIKGYNIDAEEYARLSRSYDSAHQPPARHDQVDEVRTIQCLECGAPTRRLVTGLCDTHYVEFQEWRAHKHAAALTQSPKGEEE